MVRKFEELPVDEKVVIARTIITLEADGLPLTQIAPLNNLDPSAVEKIKKLIDEGLPQIFDISAKERTKAILERIGKGKVLTLPPEPSQTQAIATPKKAATDKAATDKGKRGRKGKTEMPSFPKYGGVTKQMKDALPEVFDLIEEYNKLEGVAPLKATDSVLRTALNYMGKLNESMKPLIQQTITYEPLNTRKEELTRKVDPYYGTKGFPKQPKLDNFKVFLMSKGCPSPDEEEEIIRADIDVEDRVFINKVLDLSKMLREFNHTPEFKPLKFSNDLFKAALVRIKMLPEDSALDILAMVNTRLGKEKVDAYNKDIETYFYPEGYPEDSDFTEFLTYLDSNPELPNLKSLGEILDLPLPDDPKSEDKTLETHVSPTLEDSLIEDPAPA